MTTTTTTASATELFDSHAHVDAAAFDEDRAEVLARARTAGVTEMVLVGCATALEEADRSVRLADPAQGRYATVGVHPHDAARVLDSWWPEFERLARLPEVVAIGETGLDFYYDHSPHEVQKRRFAEQIELARRVGKAVVCHVRDAHAEARAILAEAGRGVEAIIHCFTGTPEDASAYAELGLYVSFSGIVTFRGKKSDPIREAVKRVPRERLLIETDCPYLAPEPHRGQRNEPSYLVHTAAVVARQAELSPEELGALARTNARRVFGLPPVGGA